MIVMMLLGVTENRGTAEGVWDEGGGETEAS